MSSIMTETAFILNTNETSLSPLATRESILTGSIESNMSSTCEYFRSKYNDSSLDHSNFTTWSGKVVIQVVLASLVSIVNIFVMVALLKSWKKFQQNIYIFALNIVICDALLGLVNFANSVHHLVARESNADDLLQETELFYVIKASIFVGAELSSAGHTVFITLSFNRYVSAQLYKQPHKRVSNVNTSVLISRRKSVYLSLAVWLVAVTIFIIGLAWNCATECECFIEQGILKQDFGSYNCLNNYHCSFLFPPMKGIYAGICGALFLLALLIITVMCVKTVYRTGGLGLSLPCYCHCAFRRNKTTSKTADYEADTPKRQKKTSVHMSYLQNMTHFIFFVTITYIICRFPANILLVIDSANSYQSAGGQSLASGTPVLVADIFSLLALSHSLLNPIVYWFTLHRLKQAVRDLLDDCCCFRTVVIQKGITTNPAPSTMSVHLSQTEWGLDSTPNTAPENVSTAGENTSENRT